jgi:hypothetical protein
MFGVKNSSRAPKVADPSSSWKLPTTAVPGDGSTRRRARRGGNRIFGGMLVGVLVIAGTLVAAGTGASADQSSRHYGPFDSASPDSGTCGNNWANDTFKRHFDAATTPNADTTYTVVESFIAGRFVTVAGPSPNACDPSGTPGSTIRDGVTGNFSGSFTVVVAGGIYNPNAECSESTCGNTADFVSTVYGPTATSNVTTFDLTYHGNGPGLIQRAWTNASADQGGNSGDIRSS